MQRTGALYLRRAFFLALMSAFVLGATSRMCRAQVDDEDDDASIRTPTASLSLTFNNRGDAKVLLLLDQAPSDWQPIQAALAESLHCPPQAFAHPSASMRSTRGLAHMRPEQKAQYEKFLNDADQRQLQANCNQVLTAGGWTVGGKLSLQTIAEALAQSGQQLLFVTIQRPKSDFEEQSSEGLQPNRAGGRRDNIQFLF